MRSTRWNRRFMVGALVALACAGDSNSFANGSSPNPIEFYAMGEVSSTKAIPDGPPRALVPVEQERLYAPTQMLLRPALAMDGDVAVLGGVSFVDVANGAAFLYTRNGALWNLEAIRLEMLPYESVLSLGTSVAISGTTAILGAPLSFQQTGGVLAAMGANANGWQSASLLLPTQASPGDHAGKAVAVSGSMVVIGAPDWVAHSGAAFAFEFSFGKWEERGMIVPMDSAADAYFGSAIALSGNNLIVGAYGAAVGAEMGQGAAYVFEKNGMSWVQKKKLTASDGKAGDAFGKTVAISGDIAMVGAALHDVNGSMDQGSAYVYVRDSGAWTEQAVLTAADGQANDKFGSQVSISKEIAIVGAIDDNTGMQGATGSVHLFRQQGTAWTHVSQWTGAPNTHVGEALTISGTTVLAFVAPNDLSDPYVSVFDILGELGEPCSANHECLSGQCVTGQCCPSNCDDGNACTMDTCEAGACLSTLMPCAADACNDRQCNPQTGVCETKFKSADTSCSDGLACTVGDHCVAGACKGDPLVCPGVDTCHIGVCDDSTGKCTIKIDAQNVMCVETNLKLGASCLSELQCASGHCVDGVCCDSACESGCHTCVVPNFVGTCALEPFGEDYRGTCGDTHTCSRTCSGQEVPSGMDPCAAANTATKCSFEACFDATHSQTAAYCINHDQPCPAPELRDCGAYACNPALGVCRTECSSVAECAPGLACNPQGRCIVPPPVSSGEYLSCSVGRSGAPDGKGLAGAVFVMGIAVLGRMRRRRIAGLGLIAALVALLCGCSSERDVSPLEMPSTMQVQRAGPTNTLFAVTEQAEVKPNQPKAGRLYGSSASIQGDTAVVGAPRELVGANARQGAAFVFALQSGGSWVEQAMLVANDGTSFAHFGTSVAVSGDTVVVGAPSVNAAYVFVRVKNMQGIQWVLQSKLVANDPDGTDGFGTSVAIEGDTVIVGADRKVYQGATKGGAYVFVRNGINWTQEAMLVDGGQTVDDLAGTSVALSANTAIVGAPGHDNGLDFDVGCVYIYLRNGTEWLQQAYLKADDAAAFDVFGSSVAVSGDTVLIGAPGAGLQIPDEGAAYVYVRNGSTWSKEEKLVGSGLPDGKMGAEVALEGDTAFVGAPGDSEIFPALGASYAFTRLAAAWTFKQKVWPSVGNAGDRFGSAVSLSNGIGLVGAFANDSGGLTDVGTAFTFQGLSASGGVGGTPCTSNTQCQSLSCVDGVCCGISCNGDCNTCSGATCTPRPNGIACDDYRTCTTATCQAGKCIGTPLVCMGDACNQPFCDPIDGLCKPNKLTNTPCDDANPCTLTDTCNAGVCVGTNSLSCPSLDACHIGVCVPASGQCQMVINSTNSDCPRLELGQACVIDADCGSGHCVDGACCDSACDAKCQTCVLPGKAGHCVPEPKGHDRHGSCGSLGTCISTCSGVDAASGENPCIESSAGSQCGLAQCVDATHSLSAAYCVGPNEPCPPATLQDCGDYGCDSIYGTCRTQCTTVHDCVFGRVCNPSGHCVAPPPTASGGEGGCACSAPGRNSEAPLGLVGVVMAMAYCARRRR